MLPWYIVAIQLKTFIADGMATRNVKRLKKRTLHSANAGILETTACNNESENIEPIKNIQKPDLLNLMKDTVLGSLKSSLVKAEKKLKNTEVELKRSEDQSQNLIKIISNMESDIQNLKSKNKELVHTGSKMIQFGLKLGPNEFQFNKGDMIFSSPGPMLSQPH